MQTNRLGQSPQFSTGQKIGAGISAAAPATGPFAPFVAAAGALISAFGKGGSGPAVAKGADFNGQLGPAGLTGTIMGYSANSAQQFSWAVPLETADAKRLSEQGAAAIRAEFGPLALQEGLAQDEVNRILGAQYSIYVAVGPYVQIYPAIIEAYRSQLGAAFGAALDAARRTGAVTPGAGVPGGLGVGTLLAAGAALFAMLK